MHTKSEILVEIELLEQVMNRACTADANMAELRRDDLVEIALNMRTDQLADCAHLFWSE